MREVIKAVITHFFVITVAVMFVISAQNLIIGGPDYKYPAEYPWVIMLTGLLGALPTFLFYFKKENNKKQFYTRVVIHFVLITALILTEGRLVGWYDKFSEGVIIFISILAIYFFVWLFTCLMNRNIVNGINNALEKFNNDETED